MVYIREEPGGRARLGGGMSTAEYRLPLLVLVVRQLPLELLKVEVVAKVGSIQRVLRPDCELWCD